MYFTILILKILTYQNSQGYNGQCLVLASHTSGYKEYNNQITFIPSTEEKIIFFSNIIKVDKFWVQSETLVQTFWMQSKTFVETCKARPLLNILGAKQDFCKTSMDVKQVFYLSVCGAKQGF